MVDVDEATAKRAAIDMFYKEERDEWLRTNPQILEWRRADRARLNAYLRQRGFEPEPETDE